MVTPAANLASCRWLVEEGLNAGNLAVLGELMANHVQEFQNLINARLQAFPDLHCTIEDELADGDKVALRMTLNATHSGDWLGVAATGRQVRWSAMLISRFEKGKIVGGSLLQDELNLLRQIEGYMNF